VDALVAEQKSLLDKAVAAGRLEQAQEDRLAANLRQRIGVLVQAKRSTTAAPFPRGFGFGLGGGRGAPPSGSDA
jgi:hypothetical protein